MEDAADAEFLGGSCDGVVHLAHVHELQRLHPVAQIVEHQHAFLSSSTLYLTSEALHDNLHDNDGLTSRAHMYERKENSTHRHLR
jgi:hypothetical protein